jgi:hypothetical protein
MDLQGFWMDVGQPPDYLIGMCLYLNALKENGDDKLSTLSESIVGPVIVVRACALLKSLPAPLHCTHSHLSIS